MQFTSSQIYAPTFLKDYYTWSFFFLIFQIFNKHPVPLKAYVDGCSFSPPYCGTPELPLGHSVWTSQTPCVLAVV